MLRSGNRTEVIPYWNYKCKKHFLWSNEATVQYPGEELYVVNKTFK